MTEINEPTARPRFFRIPRIVLETGISKSKLFGDIRRGRLKALKLDGVVLIKAEALERYLARAEPWSSNKRT